MTIRDKLDQRIKESSLRALTTNQQAAIDFCSNDYLGFAQSNELYQLATQTPIVEKTQLNGSTGSRLLNGNTKFAEQLEQEIAQFHQGEAALIFNSGYDANLGVFSSIPLRNDILLYDEYCHASIRDGMHLSHAKAIKFRHNDTVGLEQLLQRFSKIQNTQSTQSTQSNGVIYIAIESVYSMDGDLAPLATMVALANKYKAILIVDEAHATGIYGNKGQGRVAELGLTAQIPIRIHTFGKALGVHGAAVVTTAEMRDYLINFARSFIYSTALPIHSLSFIKASYGLIEKATQPRADLFGLIHYFKTKSHLTSLQLILSESPIQSVIIPGNQKVKDMSMRLKQKGYDVRPILSPTVPAGTERLRICLHSFNTTTQIDQLLQILTT